MDTNMCLSFENSKTDYKNETQIENKFLVFNAMERDTKHLCIELNGQINNKWAKQMNLIQNNNS